MKYCKYVYDTVAETEKAFALEYCKAIETRIPVWFPKSQCIITEKNDVGNRFVYIPMWLARKDGKRFESYDARFQEVVER